MGVRRKTSDCSVCMGVGALGRGNFWGEANVYSLLLFKAHPSVHTGQPRLPTRLGRETVLPEELLGNNGRKYGLGEWLGWGGCGERMWAGRCWGSRCEKRHTAAGPSFLPPGCAVSTAPREIVSATSRSSPSRELPEQLIHKGTSGIPSLLPWPPVTLPALICLWGQGTHSPQERAVSHMLQNKCERRVLLEPALQSPPEENVCFFIWKKELWPPVCGQPAHPFSTFHPTDFATAKCPVLIFSMKAPARLPDLGAWWEHL